MNYKSHEAKVRVELIRGGTQIIVLANRGGMRYLAELCEGLADEDYDQHRPPHHHVEPALYTAEPGSVPLELLLKEDL
jgi:hypothetical protein